MDKISLTTIEDTTDGTLMYVNRLLFAFGLPPIEGMSPARPQDYNDNDVASALAALPFKVVIGYHNLRLIGASFDEYHKARYAWGNPKVSSRQQRLRRIPHPPVVRLHCQAYKNACHALEELWVMDTSPFDQGHYLPM